MVRVCTHPIFENTTFAVIGLNALWLGFDSDNNDADTVDRAPFWAQLGESFFAIYFTFEVMVRFFSFKYKRNCLKDGWFKFDSALVGMMVVETWAIPLMSTGGKSPLSGMSILRLLRLLRLTRMMRLMKALPELLVLIKGMVAASSAVASSMVLLVLSIYIFGIIFTSSFAKAEDPEIINRYGTLWLSCFHLFMAVTLLDNIIDVMYSLRDSP